MLKERILEIYNLSKRRYGAPKIRQALAAEGIKISVKRTYRLMMSLGIIEKEYIAALAILLLKNAKSWPGYLLKKVRLFVSTILT